MTNRVYATLINDDLLEEENQKSISSFGASSRLASGGGGYLNVTFPA